MERYILFGYFSYILFHITVCSGQELGIDTPFVNVAGKKGQTVVMSTKIQKTQESDFVGITWFHPSVVTGITLWQENFGANQQIGGGQENADQYFSVEMIAGANMLNEYRLTINIPNNDQAASFVASTFEAKVLLYPAVKTSAQLVVLGDVECPSSGDTKLENSEVTMKCSVPFMGYRAPELQWTDYNDQEIGPDFVVDETYHYVNVTATKQASSSDHNQPFTCSLEFTTNGIPGSSVDTNNGPPPMTYTDSCMTQFMVEYGVTNVRVFPDPDLVASGQLTLTQGDTLHCNASGSNTVSYLWYCDDQVDGAYIAANGQDLLIEGDQLVKGDTLVTCECRAQNMVQGQTYDESKQVQFYAYPMTTADPMTSTDPMTTAGVAKSMGIFFLVVSLVSITSIYIYVP